MSSLNKVQLIGRLGKDPEIKFTNDNVPVAKFSLATTETYKDKSGQKQETTEWHNIVCWRNLAEIAEKFLSKGKQVYIEGKIKSRSWDDKDGVKRYITEIIADNFIMLDRRENTEQHTDNSTPKTIDVPAPESSPAAEDDLPF
jgi:single-strand DNA-binding protein